MAQAPHEVYDGFAITDVCELLLQVDDNVQYFADRTPRFLVRRARSIE